MLIQNKKIKLSYCYSLIAAIIIISSCKKIVDVGPPSTQITSENVYSSDASAIAVLNGLYTKLSATNYSTSATIPTITMWAGLSADEFTLWSGATLANQIAYYRNELKAQSPAAGPEFWNNVYPLIYICNSAIEGLNASAMLTPLVKQQLIGEAKFMRAFFYFYLVNFYGDVPIVLNTVYTVNALLPRSPKEMVYEQIVLDLKDAQSLLLDGYVKGDGVSLYSIASAEKVRPNKAVATALLARVYLFIERWSDAEIQATAVISNISYDTVSLNKVFLKNSKEAIWQLQPVTFGAITNTPDAVTFVLTVAPAGANNSHPVFLSQRLLIAFELGDQRKLPGNWINAYTDALGTYYYPYKYKDVSTGTTATPTEYLTIFRLSEQYLIRSEARAQQGNIIGAQSDLNIIRRRAGLANTNANDKSSLISAIFRERQVELFSELGHRWLDMKRSSIIDSVMTVVTILKGGTWKSSQQLYPLPVSDLLRNPNLAQNGGY